MASSKRRSRTKNSKRKRRTRTKNSKRRAGKTQKVWNMKGCAHSQNHQCALCKHKNSMKGGNCSSCANPTLMKGGYSFYKPAAPIPGPFIGQSWSASVNDWPGVNGVGGDRNYLSQNMYLKDPQTMMMLGGKMKRKRVKGGGLVPQSLTNLGRSIGFNAGSIYNTLNGYAAPVNPLPYEGQLPNASKQLLI